MYFTLTYLIDGVQISLSVDTLTAEEAERRMKRCISKMLKDFPVGQLFTMISIPMNIQPPGQYSPPPGSVTTFTPTPNSQVYTVGGYVTYNTELNDYNLTGTFETTNLSSPFQLVADNSFVLTVTPSSLIPSASGTGNNTNT